MPHKLLTAKEAGALLGISARRVRVLCEQGRIKGSRRIGWAWIIPLPAAGLEVKPLHKSEDIKP